MNVPKLRFKEFTDEWNKNKLGEFTKVLMCKRIFANQTSEFYDIPFYKIGTMGGRPDTFISRELFEDYKNKYSYPRKGELLITCSGSVGKCLVFNGEDSYYQDSNIVWLDNPTELVSNQFLYYVISHVNWSALNSTTITRIYGDNLRQLEVKYPSKNEQIKITTTLKLLDRKIKLQTRKIEALKLYKKGLDKFIFNNEYLFFKEKFKLYFDSDGGTALEEFISENGTHRIISIGNYSQDGTYIDNNQKVLFNDKTATKLLCKDNLVMILNDKTTTGDIIGSTLLIDKDDTYIYNQRSQKLICKGINPQYAWCFLNNCLFRKQVFRLSQGGTQIYINFSVLENQNILIPKDDKIEKMIIESIIGVKDKIVLETRKLMNLEKLKKGLIQKMFV